MPNNDSLSDYYLSIITFFSNHLRRENQLSHAVRETTVSHAKRLCQFLQSIDREGFPSARLKDVNEYIVMFGKAHDTMLTMLSALKKFNAYLKTRYDITCVDFDHVLIARPAVRRKLQVAFSKEDVMAILFAIKMQNRPSVKRDTAIVELAASTGLRAIDIGEMKLTDIDWNTHEIRITQCKTGQGLCLPLNAKTGNAIADYILTERPQETNCQQIFLTSGKPFRKLRAGSIGAHITTYFAGADIGYVPGAKMGFHSFRRYVASQLIDNDVELDTVREVLGHKRINSLKPYIRISRHKLSDCALGFDDIPVLQEELV
jgi:site-specific recombinase XerD